MNPVLPADAVEFGESVRKAFGSLGGVDAARRAEVDPASRGAVGDLLGSLGIGDLDPRSDGDAAAAAAVLCSEAGRVALPYPVAGVVLRTGGLPVAPVPASGLRVDHGDLFEQWLVVDPDGRSATARPQAAPLATRLGPFACDLAADLALGRDVATSAEGADEVLRWWLVLSGWTVLGALERSVELATTHTSERIQFGQPLTAFQTVRFALADASIAVVGLRELALFALWRLQVAPASAWPDVLALRSHALDVARTVLRSTQQLHGATGLCDEADISILVRHLQPTLRLPAGAEATARQLVDAIERDGFDGLFAHGAAPVAGGTA